MDSASAAHTLRDARLALGLSQGRVARDTGISRSQLSLFEGRKFLLDRSKLSALRTYYAKRGHRFSDSAIGPRAMNPATSSGGSRDDAALTSSDLDLLDGFAVAGGIDRARAEAWLDQIAAND